MRRTVAGKVFRKFKGEQMKVGVWGMVWLCLAVPVGVWADVFSGSVVDAITGAGLPGAEITSASGAKAKSGPAGAFSFDSVDQQVKVTLPGYADLNLTLQGAGNRLALNALPDVRMAPVKVRAKADTDKVAVSEQKMNQAEVKEVTATLFPDVVRVMQLMPGVTTDNDFSANMFVRGGGFDETIAVLDDMIILTPYIWGGRLSIFNPNLVDSVDFSTGGFPAEWPQAMSAVMNVHNKTGNPDEFKGFVDLSATTLDVFLEGPVPGAAPGASFLLGLRRTQYDLVEKLYSHDNAVYPYFYDGQAKVRLPLGLAHLTFNSIFSVEGMNYTLQKDDGYGSAHEGDSGFYYLDKKVNLSAAYDTPVTDTLSMMTLVGLFYSDGSYQLADALNPYHTYSNQTIAQLRHIWTWVPERHETVKAGINAFLGDGEANVKEQIKVPTSENTYYQNDVDYTFKTPWSHFSGVFLEDTIELVDHFLYLNPSANAQVYSLSRQWLWDPRCGLKASLTRAWDLYTAVGQYSQFPLSTGYLDAQYGNPNLKAEQATHYIVGTKIDAGQDYFFQLEGFYKDYRNLIVADPDPALNYTNHGVGHAYGYDLIFQKRLGGKWDGWVTYSYVVSERKITQRSDPRDFGKPDMAEPVGQWYRADGDITHAVNLILNYSFTPRWKLAFTQKYSTGKPYTPVVGGAYQPAIDEYTPIYGGYNSARMSPYMTTDIKLSMPLGSSTAWSSYVQVSNLFDVKNVDSYQYQTDYSGSRPIDQLSRMIIGGFRYEF
jgi:hypothetical protein